ncbi:hypothetical protein NM688_g3918 [Phlebia brevispora]|uniref:Uncharacterized protein n=1 Tax=Phlebia brevispora TaxID=194682 RepID=A0ACC1T4J4_9APHY|nr:hypothetical protein NM688_g3918 [Phlebia brevispora]
MDSTQQKEATSHSGESSSSSPASLETKVLRSSARVKAAKQKEKEKERVPTDQQSSSSSSSKRSRESTSSKGKGKEVAEESSRAGKRARRTTYSVSAPLTINEPTKDLKGKKRAVPEDNSEEETITSISAPVKRTRTTNSYSLRSRDTTTPNDMPKKPRSTPAKGKAVSASRKAIPPPIPSTSRHDDEDVEMLDATDCMHEDMEEGAEKHHDDEDHVIDDEDREDGGGTDEDEDEEDDMGRPDDGGRGSLADDSAPLSIFAHGRSDNPSSHVAGAE